MKRRYVGWMGLAVFFITLSIMMSGGLRPVLTTTPRVVVAQESSEVAPAIQSAIAIGGTYEDPLGLFKVAILENYSVSTAAGSPVFQTGDGSLAYSVVRVPLQSESPLSEIGLVEVVQQTFAKGEGFQTQTFSAIPGNGLQIEWTGRLSQGAASPQPLSGTILVMQTEADAYLLMVAALDAAASQVPGVLSVLADTLTIL